MAFWWENDQSNPQDQAGVTWGDWASAFFNVGGSELLSTLPAAIRYTGDKLGNDVLSAGAEAWQHRVNNYTQESIEGLSPAAQKKLQSTFGDEGFWTSFPIKGLTMAPSVIASVGSLMLAPEVAPAWLSLGVSGGALNAGQSIDNAYQKIDNLPEDELMKNDLYRGYRLSGLSKDEARKRLFDTMEGAKPAMAFAVGALAANVGLPGRVAGVAAGDAEGTLVQKFLKGTGMTAGAGAAQSGADAALEQQGNVQGGFQKGVNYDQIIKQAIEGANPVAAALGGVGEAAHGAPKGKAKSKSESGFNAAGDEGNEPDAAQSEAIDATKPEETPPAEPAPATSAPEATPAPAEPAAQSEEAQPATEAPAAQPQDTTPVQEPATEPAPTQEQPVDQQVTPEVTPDQVAAPTKQPAGQVIKPPKAFSPDEFKRSMTALGLPVDALKGLDGEKQAMTALSHPAVADHLEQPFQIDDTKHIPYIAGYSKGVDANGARTMFVDARWPKDLEREHTLLHERVEDALIKVYGYGYRYSHKIATAAERASFFAKHPNATKADWEAYQKRVLSLGKTMVHSDPSKIPSILDETPYRDTADQGGMERLRGEPLAGEVIPPGEARVLADLTKTQEADRYEAEARKQRDNNIKGMLKEEQGPQPGHRTIAEKAKKTHSNDVAKEIFDKTKPEEKVPSTPAEYEALRDRLKGMLDEAKARGAKIPGHVTEATFDHPAYLREVADVHKILSNKGNYIGKGDRARRTQERVTDFLMRERAAKGGDFSILRSERKAAGELASRKDQTEGGNVEELADKLAVEPDVEKEEHEEPLPPPTERTVKITPELKAHYEKLAKDLENKQATKVTPKVTPKVEALKNKVAASAEQKKAAIAALKNRVKKVEDKLNKSDNEPTKKAPKVTKFEPFGPPEMVSMRRALRTGELAPSDFAQYASEHGYSDAEINNMLRHMDDEVKQQVHAMRAQHSDV